MTSQLRNHLKRRSTTVLLALLSSPKEAVCLNRIFLFMFTVKKKFSSFNF